MNKKLELFNGRNVPQLERDERDLIIQQLMQQSVRELQNQMERVVINQEALKEEVSQVKDYLNNRITLDHGQQQAVQNAKKKRVERLWREGAYNKDVHDTKRKLHGAAGSALNNAFGVSSYRDIKEKDFEEALNFVKNWRPRIV